MEFRWIFSVVFGICRRLFAGTLMFLILILSPIAKSCTYFCGHRPGFLFFLWLHLILNLQFLLLLLLKLSISMCFVELGCCWASQRRWHCLEGCAYLFIELFIVLLFWLLLCGLFCCFCLFFLLNHLFIVLFVCFLRC